jgi:hypothetical protein
VVIDPMYKRQIRLVERARRSSLRSHTGRPRKDTQRCQRKPCPAQEGKCNPSHY